MHLIDNPRYRRLLFILIISLSVILLVLSSIFTIDFIKDYSRWQELSARIIKKTDSFNGLLSLEIKDLNRGFLISLNPDTEIPAASLAKLPVMASIFKKYDKKEISLSDYITLRSIDRVGGSGILKNSRAGSRFTVGELIELMITISDNTATNLLINFIGFDYINSSMKEFGLENSNLSRLMMDMRSRSKGIENYTTATDMARILKLIYKGRLINKDISKYSVQILKEQKSKNRIPAKLPKDTEIAHKTGLENGVCHDVGIVYTENGDFIISALTQHKNRTSVQSKKLIAEIAHLVYNYYIDD